MISVMIIWCGSDCNDVNVSFFVRNSVDLCIIAAYNISTINSTVLSTERGSYDCNKTNGCKSKY